MDRTSFHVKKQTKEKLDILRNELNIFRKKRLTQERFLDYLADKLRNADLEAVSFIESSQLNELLKRFNYEIEFLPTLIISNDNIDLINEIFKRLSAYNLNFLYFTSDYATIFVFKRVKLSSYKFEVIS